MTTDAKWSDFLSLDRGRTLAAANQLLPGWISLLLVVAIAWELAKVVWLLVPAPAAGDSVSMPAVQAPTAGANGGATDAQAIAAAHIFGVAGSEPVEAPAPVIDMTENLSDTRLTSLSLTGTMAAVPPEKALAIITGGIKEGDVYSIGNTVTSGARLHAVYPDRVVLNENGVLTVLRLPEISTSTASVAAARRSAAASVSATEPTDSIQSVVAQNVSQLADIIRPTPYFVNGEQQGYRVYPGRNRQQFAALGLRPGDLIKDIDGQSLTDPQQAMQIFQNLDNADQVSVTVERDGQPEVIVLSTSQLDLGDENSQ